MWATVVDRDGIVCAVAFSGVNRSAQWPGFALSSANLYSGVQPGGSAYALEHGNPVDTAVAYGGNPAREGTAEDGMVGKRIGGTNVFGGGLGLYDRSHAIIGGVGVSGDTSCADHDIAWRVRHALNLDHLAASGSLPAVPGVASVFAGDTAHPDNIIYDITPNPEGGTGVSASGFGHPTCLNTGDPGALPPVQP
jgi:uncharacterized protein GlcG (DUF336 family)